MASKIVVALAALLCASAPASAVDSVFAEVGSNAEMIVFEPTSNWYLIGNISYVPSSPVYDFSLGDLESQTRRFGYGTGTGYRFSDRLRADLTMNYVISDWYADADGANVTGRHKIWSSLLSGYVDLGTYSGFTPYVGAGVGAMRTIDTMRRSLPDPTPFMKSTQTELAYSLNAGVGYRMSDSVTLDIGYQFLASPKTEYLDFSSMTVDSGVQQHLIKVGLRYYLP